MGIETFYEIRNLNFVYVDKTEFIHKLVNGGKYYFLSRPRRFGKSLLLSTIGAFFEGIRDLFEGLAITRHDPSWVKHPVFHLNFVNANLTSEEGLLSILEHQIRSWENIYGGEENLELPQRFYGVIQRAVEQTGHKAVVLINEYDKAFVGTIGNEDLHNKFRGILKPIYATLKAADQYIRFALITACRDSHASAYSTTSTTSGIYP